MARKEKPTYVTEKEPFPQRLKTLLEEKGITQKELSNHIGCTRQAISLYVTGQSSPDINTLTRISNYFDVSADYLLGLTSTPTIDADIRSICEYTGLSEKSVFTLHSCVHNRVTKEYAQLKTGFIDALIADDELLDIYMSYLDSLVGCLLLQEEYPDIELSSLEHNNYNLLAEFDMKDPENVDYGIYFEEVNSIQPLALFKLQQSFLSFIKKLTHDYIKNDECEQLSSMTYLSRKREERKGLNDYYQRKRCSHGKHNKEE